MFTNTANYYNIVYDSVAVSVIYMGKAHIFG